MAPEQIAARTQQAYVWTRILGMPFWGLVNLLSIILYKDEHISALVVTIIIALKPASALLAPYWSQAIYRRPDRLIPNLIWANILRYVPFLLVPWLDAPWMIVCAFGLYMTLTRGIIPGWMEAIKCNLPESSRGRLVAYGSNIDYIGTALLPLGLGILLDGYDHSWRWLFPLTAILGLLSTLFFYRFPSVSAQQSHSPIVLDTWSLLKESTIKPWKASWQLIRENTGFAQFQIGFFLSGAGIMVMQPVLPMFLVDVLELSYTKLLLALALCKGIGFALTSPAWVKLFRKLSIYHFSAIVFTVAALFPLLLMCAQYHVIMLYVAYGLYGVMQAGSELGWHMSGPCFAQEKDSTVFSSTNVLMVGIRGCIAPYLGALLYTFTNSTVVMVLGALMCLLATRHLMRYSSTRQPLPEVAFPK